MKVKAFRAGYYDLKRVKVGQVFEISPELFSKKWMEKLDGEKSKTQVGSKKQQQKVEEAEVVQEADVI